MFMIRSMFMEYIVELFLILEFDVIDKKHVQNLHISKHIVKLILILEFDVFYTYVFYVQVFCSHKFFFLPFLFL